MKNKSYSRSVETDAAMVKLMLSVILAFVVVLCLLPTPCESESYWVSYQYQYGYYQYNCYPYYYTTCNNWSYYGYWYGWYYWNWYWYYSYSNVCQINVGYNCYYVYQVAWATGWTCQTGFTGGNCEIPICSTPPCTATQNCKINNNCLGRTTCDVSVNPSYCSCKTNSAGQCTGGRRRRDSGELSGCSSPILDCYPGNCASSGNICECPAGFTGANCQTLNYRSTITTCGSQVLGYSPEGGALQVLANSTCAAAGSDPIPVWFRSTKIDRIEVAWEVYFDNQPELPDNSMAPYVQNAPTTIGIADSSFVLSWGNGKSNPKACSTITNPYQTIVQCNPVTLQWSELGFNIASNQSFLINVTSHVGGQKTGAPNQQYGGFGTLLFSEDPAANQTIRSMKFALDNSPPYHCLTKSNNCTVFPIFVNLSITSNATIQPTFNEWKDDESGIARFHAEIFYMQPDVDGKLVEIGSALIKKDVDIKLNNFQFTCDRPGVYSIILTVYDRAGNTAKARKIITYNDEPITISNSPMYLDKADPTTIDAQSGHAFINKLDNPPDGVFHFTANWTGHFVNNYPPAWLARVKSWQDLGIEGIDDNHGSKYGVRSIDQVTGLTGIISFSYAYKIDSNGGIGAIPPENFTQLTDKQTALTLDIPKDQLKNGQTIVVWVKAYDITGSSNIIVSKTFVDTDPFSTKVISKEFKLHSSDQFNSSVLIHVENRISGIKNISYQILDVTLGSSAIKSVTVLPQIMRPENTLGSISRRKRRQSSDEEPCDPTVDTTCYCIPLGDCYNKIQEILIDNCWIDRRAGDHLKVVYTITSLSGLSVGGFQDLGTPSLTDIPCRPPTIGELSGGAIAGLVIGITLGCILLIIAIVLFVLSRVKPNHAIPTRMRTMAHTVHNKFAQPAMMESELPSREDYVKNVNEPKFKSAMEAKNKESFGYNVSSKNVQTGDILAEGRFAVIRKGLSSQNNQNVPVALKALRSNHTQCDNDLMRSEILFMAKLKTHPNIVRFIGAVEDDNGSNAPVMLLEYCDISLNDWLSNITKLTTDELENMLTFSLNIANGVEHLHKQKIIHRRLAMRNVLLKNGMNGLEAKLIGFGPSADTEEDNADEESGQQAAAVVPMKWLAPETLDSLRSKRPVYDEKTDAWSYAVTVWEIYSKGAAPFSNYRNNDMKDVLKRGERMVRPDQCPTEIFDKVVNPCWNISPDIRPAFSTIIAHLQQFKNGSDKGTRYSAPGEGGSGSGGNGGYYYSGGARASMYPGQKQHLDHDAR